MWKVFDATNKLRAEVAQVWSATNERLLLLSNRDCAALIMILEQRSRTACLIVLHVVHEHLSKQPSCLELVVRSRPIHFLLEPLDHSAGKFHFALSHRTSFEILNIAVFKRQSLRVNESCRIAEAADRQNRLTALLSQTFLKGFRNYLRRTSQTHDTTD